MLAATNRHRSCGMLLALGLAIGVFGCLLLALAVAVFYLEEDARGASAWKKAAQQIEAQGISLRRDDYIPSMPPPDQNFGALPLFAIEPDPDAKWPQGMKSPALEAALKPLVSHMGYKDSAAAPDMLPFLKRWDQGPPPDLAALRAQLADICRRVHPEAPPAPDEKATALIARLCPVLADLRSAARTRPLCVFPLKYDVQPPTEFSFSPITQLLQLARALTFEERVALYEGNGQLALDDMAVGRKIIAGLRTEPFLVSGLTAVALEEYQVAVIEQGLASHSWSDAQLQHLATDIESLDVLQAARFWLTGEIVAYGHPVGDYYEQHRWVDDDVFRGFQNRPFDSSYKPAFLAKAAFYLEPKGWLELDRATGDQYLLCDVAGIFDVKQRRVDAGHYDAASAAIVKEKSWTFWSLPPVSTTYPFGTGTKNLAFCQVHVDEAQIACRLERYHLAHGVYPPSLDSAGGGEFPHDVMNGEPYHYRLRPDGTFLLYSVGWNQEDDHGISTVEPGQFARDALDWVWPNLREPTSR